VITAASSLPIAAPASLGERGGTQAASVGIQPFMVTRTIPAARTVAAADAALLMSALMFARANGSPTWPQTVAEVMSLSISLAQTLQLLVFTATALVVFRAMGLYDAMDIRRRGAEIVRIIGATTVVALVTGMYSAGTDAFGRGAMVTFWLAGVSAVIVARTVRVRVIRSPARCRRALIVGSGPHALRVCRELSSHPTTAYRVLGFVDTVKDGSVTRSPFVTRRTFGTLEDLETILGREHVDEVHIGLPIRSHYPQIQETIRVCERVGIKVMYRADVFNTVLARSELDRGSPRVALRVAAEGAPMAIKRAIDVVGATALLIVLSPLMIATAIALTSRGPVIFSQVRYGLNRRRFRMLKFRTMVENADSLQALLESRNEARGPVFKIARDPRITPLGRILRRTSLDELPQLINVIKGEMSLVGPRPLPLRDVAKFTRLSDMRRFSVRPGLTGLSQVNGRSNLDFDEWIRFDLDYIDRWSLRLDVSVLARTLPAVIRGTGAA
jgi:exopolysaccharide biosynthesis polyprenyl glycosylphosphotransferase